MVKHYNPSLSEDANRYFNTKSGDQLPSEVAPFIQPTKEIKRYCNIIRQATLINGTSTTVFTSPTDKDFYLIGAHIGLIKDATSTSLLTNLNCVVDGVTSTILRLPSLTLTAQTLTSSISLDNPVKLDRNSTVTLTNSTNVANITATANIFGYTVEVTK